MAETYVTPEVAGAITGLVMAVIEDAKGEKTKAGKAKLLGAFVTEAKEILEGN